MNGRTLRAETIFSDSRLASVLHWLPDGRLIYALLISESLHDSSLWAASLQRSKNNSDPPKRIATRETVRYYRLPEVPTEKRSSSFGLFGRRTLTLGRSPRMAKQLIEHQRLTLDDRESWPTSWTPDSKAVLFSSDRNGTQEIFKQGGDQPLAEILATSVDQL